MGKKHKEMIAKYPDFDYRMRELGKANELLDFINNCEDLDIDYNGDLMLCKNHKEAYNELSEYARYEFDEMIE